MGLATPIENNAPSTGRWQRVVKPWLVKNLLPVSLVCAVCLGAAWPTPGVAVGTKVNGVSPVQYICVIVIFIISGLKLTTDALLQAITAVAGIIFGLLTILFITVVVGVKLTQQIDFPDITEFQSGLIVFFSMPTTINSGIVLTQQANGNHALAVLLTVVTNTLAVFTIPGMLAWLADFQGVSLDIGKLMLKLVLLVLVPLIAGKLAQYLPGVSPWVKRNKWPLKVVSIYALVTLPWILTSRARDDGKFDNLSARSMFALLGWAILMHVIFLAMNFSACSTLKAAGMLGTAELKAVVILGSQKTLPVSIAVISALPDSVGDAGLMAIACILAHLSQIVLDAFIIGSWVKDAKEDQSEGADSTGQDCHISSDKSATTTGPVINSTISVEADFMGSSLDDSFFGDDDLEPRDGQTYAVIQAPAEHCLSADSTVDSTNDDTQLSYAPSQSLRQEPSSPRRQNGLVRSSLV